MQQNKVVRIIEEVAPPALAAGWDKSGIQVAAARTDITHMAVCLDPAPDLIQRALDIGADMVLTHHPLSLSPRYPDQLDAYHCTLSLLFSHNIPLYAAHTSLDANPEGPAVWLADELGLTKRQLLEKTNVATGADAFPLQGGFGCVGDLPHALGPDDFFSLLAAFLPLDRMNTQARLAGSLPEQIERVALCPGSGGSLAEEARKRHADILITGDMRYHTALDIINNSNVYDHIPGFAAHTELSDFAARADVSAFAVRADVSAFAVLDVGHFALEEEMMRRMADLLATLLPDLKVSFLPGHDPFHCCGLTRNPLEERP